MRATQCLQIWCTYSMAVVQGGYTESAVQDGMIGHARGLLWEGELADRSEYSMPAELIIPVAKSAMKASPRDGDCLWISPRRSDKQCRQNPVCSKPDRHNGRCKIQNSKYREMTESDAEPTNSADSEKKNTRRCQRDELCCKAEGHT